MLLLLVLRYVFPSAWARQIAAGPPLIVLVTLGTLLFLCFFEWFFHRYVLHAVIWGPLKRFCSAHTHHHALTAISLKRDEVGPGRYVLNRYPILTEEQKEDSAFPGYTLVAFWALFTPLMVGLDRIFPHLPFLMGGYLAVAWGLSCYEVFHAIEHRPYEWWQKRTESARWGVVWKKIYGLHHMHHANIGCNEAIAGFFGLPVADWALGTYYQPRELLLDRRMATAKDFTVPPPRPMVAWMDKWARKRQSRILRSAV